jgi:hypothetical protein
VALNKKLLVFMNLLGNFSSPHCLPGVLQRQPSPGTQPGAQLGLDIQDA